MSDNKKLLACLGLFLVASCFETVVEPPRVDTTPDGRSGSGSDTVTVDAGPGSVPDAGPPADLLAAQKVIEHYCGLPPTPVLLDKVITGQVNATMSISQYLAIEAWYGEANGGYNPCVYAQYVSPQPTEP